MQNKQETFGNQSLQGQLQRFLEDRQREYDRDVISTKSLKIVYFPHHNLTQLSKSRIKPNLIAKRVIVSSCD